MKLITLQLMLLFCLVTITAEKTSDPKFIKEPTIKKVDEKFEISFSVDSYTDVAVFIENEKGYIIRHLVAGVLGKKAPAPLQTNSLNQTIYWDGNADYGKPAGKGPFKVRVSLKTGITYDKVLIRDEQELNHIKGLAVGPDGTVYILDAPGGAVWSGEQIIAFDRNGKYKSSVMPFASGMKMNQVKGMGAFTVRGRPAPLVQNHRLHLFPGAKCPRKTGMAVTPDGKTILRLSGGIRSHSYQHISAVGIDGGISWKNPEGPNLLNTTIPISKDKKYRGRWGKSIHLAVSPSGKWAYVSGFAYKKTPYASVFRVPLPSRGPAKLFFGKIESTGKSNQLLGGLPSGLVCDGKGNLLIADSKNDRVIIIKESDGSYVNEFKLASPGPLGADPKTGYIYATSLRKGSVDIFKYSNWKELKVLAKINRRIDGNGTCVMGVDVNAPKPLIWLGTDGGSLYRIEDQGAKLSATLSSTKADGKGSNGSFLDMSVDRFRPDREIYCRNNNGWWYRHNEKTEKTEKVYLRKNAGLSAGGGSGKQLLSGPDGNLYGLGYPYHMYKMDRDAKPIGFKSGGYPKETIGKYGKMDKKIKGSTFGKYVPVSMTDMTHTLGVRADGHIFVFQPGHHGGRPSKALHEYLPSGEQVTKDPIIWMASDGVIGPRFDAAGNIYIADIVNPGIRAYPKEFEQLFGKIELNKTRPTGVKNEIANMYGSIIKFSPKGGNIDYPHKDKPYKGKPKIDSSLKVKDVAYYSGRKQKPVKVTGAEWIAFGYSHVEVNACICETTRFDVDEFGRVWYPDLCLYQVRVIDTAGNPILNFGNYGNADNCGPDSKREDLKQPEIAFAWLVGVSATDKYVYTGDSINRRMLRCKITYAVEKTVRLE